MSEERKRILELLAEGKINVEEAERLLAAAAGNTQEARASAPRQPADAMPEVEESHPRKRPRWLRVVVLEKSKGSGEKKTVNIRIPLGLIKAGAKLGSVLPKSAKAKVSASLEEKGVQFDLDEINAQNIDELIEHLNDMVIDVNEDEEQVRIFCE